MTWDVKEIYETLVDTSSDAASLVDLDGRIVKSNSETARLLRFERTEDLVGHEALNSIVPEDRALAGERIERAIAEGRSVSLECRLSRRDGSVFPAELSASVVKNADSEPVGFMAILRDITERMQIQSRLSQADRMVSVGMLAAGVAHEINNPLTYVLYNLESLIEDIGRFSQGVERFREALAEHLDENLVDRIVREAGETLDEGFVEDLVERLRHAVDGSRRVRKIVSDLKVFAGSDDDRIRALRVEDAIDIAADMAHNEIKYRARLVKDFAPTPPVAGNEGRLCQVFLNLLLNAAQSIEGGAAAENEIRVSTRAKKGYVVVEIADTGCGMDDETVGRIFEPFFTTKPPGVGSGLGLPICRNFVESHGGDISVESAPGRGSRFEIRIPVERKGIALADPSLAPRPPFEAPRRGRILLIDDEELVAKSIARVLGRDHEVVTAPSGAEGMNILTRDEGFDLVLCDVMMPTVSGMDVYEWLKERSPEIARRMVFVTGGVFTAEAVEFRESVPNPWIEKPIDPGRLRDLVGDLLDPGSGGSDAGGEPRR